MASRVMTAPLAVIMKGTQVIGKMKNIRVTETIRRGRVSGLGSLTPQELPALEWNGTLNCQFYMIDMKVSGIPGANPRGVTANAQEYIDNVLLEESGVDIVIYKKVAQFAAGIPVVDATTGLVKADTLKEFAKINSAFVDREGFDITEGQISGKDQDFTYMSPILYTV
jgi:hypothetical protein